MRVPGKDISWKDFFLHLAAEWDEDKLTDVAGSLTYYAVLALFPFLLFVVALASLIIDVDTATYLIRELYRVAPAAVAEILGKRIRALSEGGSPALLTFSAVLAVWTASGGISSLTAALNEAYDVRETRPWWKVKLRAIGVTLAGAVAVILASVIALVTPAIAYYLGGVIEKLILWARMPLAALLMICVVSVLYYVLPDVKQQKFRLITPGAVVAVLIWVAVSLGFSFYVNNFGRYEVVYGALGSVIILLLWIWISSLAVLLGAEINTVLEVCPGAGEHIIPASHVAAEIAEPKEPAYITSPPPPPDELAPATTRARVVEDEAAPIEQMEEAEAPAPRGAARVRERVVDAVLGAGALITGFFVGKRLRK